MIVVPCSSHSLGIFMCELNHKVAVWQDYALNAVVVIIPSFAGAPFQLPIFSSSGPESEASDVAPKGATPSRTSLGQINH
jgi:hypothetical protein